MFRTANYSSLHCQRITMHKNLVTSVMLSSLMQLIDHCVLTLPEVSQRQILIKRNNVVRSEKLAMPTHARTLARDEVLQTSTPNDVFSASPTNACLGSSGGASSYKCSKSISGALSTRGCCAKDSICTFLLHRPL